MFLMKNRRKSVKEFFNDLAEKKFGKTISAYLRYEIKLVIGLCCFLRAPVKNYRALMNSYFGNEKLKAFFVAIPLLIVLEASLIHLLIASKFTSIWEPVLHVIMIISEIYVCELLVGNLYYVQFSEVKIDDHLTYKLGILWELKVPISEIERLEVSIRGLEDKNQKLALMNEPLTRIFFKSPVAAKKHFKIVYFKQADFYLNERDLESLKTRLNQERLVALI